MHNWTSPSQVFDCIYFTYKFLFSFVCHSVCRWIVIFFKLDFIHYRQVLNNYKCDLLIVITDKALILNNHECLKLFDPWWPSGLTYGFSSRGPWIRNKACTSVFSRIRTRNYIWNFSRAFVSYVRKLAQTSEPIQRCVWSFLSTKEPRGDCGPSCLILTGACAWMLMMNCTKQKSNAVTQPPHAKLIPE